jgi:hypothetical protein
MSNYLPNTPQYPNDDPTIPFTAGSFPDVSAVHEAWGTGDGSENQWWKPGTTTGGGYDRLDTRTETC